MSDPATVGSQVCKKCGQRKHVLAFGACPKNSNGIQEICRGCEGDMPFPLAIKPSVQPRAGFALKPWPGRKKR